MTSASFPSYRPLVPTLLTCGLLVALAPGCGRKPTAADELHAGFGDQRCWSCHGDRYEATTQPDHVAGAFPTDCGVCHQTDTWTPAAAFDHDLVWPLTGKHAEVGCTQCHEGGRFSGTPRDCEACHLSDYEATTDPNHVAQGFPKTCQTCHSTEGWSPADFAGHDQFWPLTGKHKVTSCAACHQGDVYAGTPRQCEGCHLPDYQATTDPNHVAQGFPKTCQTCHSTDAWSPATFADHDQFWPLTGKHKVTSCAACHQGDVYAGTPRQCEGCHLPDYQATTNPEHAALGLAKTCETCHTTGGWQPADFPVHQQYFPIKYGPHAKFSCRDCHPSSQTSWANFTCTGCHTGAHTLSKMNAEHSGEVWGYSSKISSLGADRACLSCHPSGYAEDD